MRNILLPSAALVLLAGCTATPPVPSGTYYYVPSWPPPSASYDAPVAVDPSPYVSRSSASVAGRTPPARDPVPINAPLPGVPAGDDCGSWRLCNLPGWRYEY
jgi:hypothetical protein